MFKMRCEPWRYLAQKDGDPIAKWLLEILCRRSPKETRLMFWDPWPEYAGVNGYYAELPRGCGRMGVHGNEFINIDDTKRNAQAMVSKHIIHEMADVDIDLS